MKRTKVLRRSRLKARGPRSKKSGGHLFPKNVDEQRRAWIQAQPCHVLGRRTGVWYVDPKVGWRRVHVVCAHVKSRGSSGPDKGNMIPLDAALHDQQGLIGWPEFERRHGFDRIAVAARYEARYLAQTERPA